MRIVHANKAYWPHLGGVETVVRDLAEGGARRGHDVQVLTGDGPGPQEVGGIPIHRSRSLGRVRSVPLSAGLAPALWRAHGDVLHVHEPSVWPEAAIALRSASVRRSFGRLVLSWHSDVIRQRTLLRLYGPVLRRCLHASDKVLVASPNHLRSSQWLHEVADKVEVVPFGVDIAAYEAGADTAARVARLRALHGEDFILFLGRLVYYKGIQPLLSAVDRLPDARFVLVGQGPMRSQVAGSRAARDGRLVVLDPVDPQEKIALLHACRALVLPSTEPSEAYGIVLVEAMACQRPIVTFDLPTGVTWLNRDGENGLVVPVGDQAGLAEALGRLLGDAALASRLGRAGRRRVEAELTLERQVDATLKAYGVD